MEKICKEPGCKRKARKGHKDCHRCNMKKYREKSPIRYVFMTLKHNALRRGKIFHLNLEEFTNFLLNNPLYMQLKGRFNECLQIDRISNPGGYGPYEIGNLQVITKHENLEKIKYEEAETEDTWLYLQESDLPF